MAQFVLVNRKNPESPIILPTNLGSLDTIIRPFFLYDHINSFLKYSILATSKNNKQTTFCSKKTFFRTKRVKKKIDVVIFYIQEEGKNTGRPTHPI